MLQRPPAGDGTGRGPCWPQGSAASLALGQRQPSSLRHFLPRAGPGLLLLISDKAPLFPALRLCLCISCGAEPPPPPASGTRASSGSVPRVRGDTPAPHVHGDPNHREGTETPTAANPGPKDLSHPDSLPRAGRGEPTTPCAPAAAQQTDGWTDRVHPCPCCHHRVPSHPPGAVPKQSSANEPPPHTVPAQTH